MRASPIATAIEPTLIRAIFERARPTSLHLGLGQPDLPLASWAREALQSVETAAYTPNRGLPELVERISAKYGGASTIVTSGTQEAMALAILGLVHPGTDVLVPDPGFPAYPNLVRAAGARPIPYRFGGDFALDPALLDAAWTEHTRAVILNSPSNPTGAVASTSATRAAVELIEERGAFWISDEIYEDLVWEGTHQSAGLFGRHGVVLSGISKSHSAMGLRIGWLAGPVEFVDCLLPLHQHLVACAARPSQLAAVAMLDHHEEQLAVIRPVLRARRELALKHIASWDVPLPALAGAFYAFVDVRRALRGAETSVDLAIALLDECDVVTIPGAGFGVAGEGYLRLAYTVDETILSEALGRVGEFLRKRSSA